VVQAVEYVALLNHDTVVDENWLAELVHALDAHQNAASAQSLLLYKQDKQKINSAGNEIHFLGFGYSHGNGNPRFVISTEAQRSGEIPHALKKGSLDTARDDRAPGIRAVTYASGAAVLYRKKTFKEIGFFDEDLFMYHEDLDTGWKFLLKGYQNILVPTSIVYHHYEFSRSIQKYYWQERNRLLLLLTHYKVRTILLLLPPLLALEIGLLFFSLIRGFFKSRVQAYRWIFTHVPIIFRKRRFVQKLRTHPDSEVLTHFTGVITDQEVSNPVVNYLMNPVFSAYLFLIKKIISW
jgi:GT2 family glycosyltransferase